MGVRKHVHRILNATRKGVQGDVRVFPNFVLFGGETRRPIWWQEDVISTSWGEILGVHENEPGKRAGSIVIAEKGLAVLGPEKSAMWVSYDDIDRWDRLSKDPISQALVLWTRVGERVELPFHGGGAFAFVQFLGGAMRECAGK